MGVALLVWLLVTWLFAQAFEPSVSLGDLIGYWSTGRVFWQGGNPYSSGNLLPVQRAEGWIETAPMMVWAPPWVLAITVVLGLMPFWTARMVWLAASVGLLIVASDYLWRFCGGEPGLSWVGWLAGILFAPATVTLLMGQFSILLLAGVVGFLWAIQKGHDGAAGAFLALVAIKPHVLYVFLIVIALWVWQERRWRILASAVACLLLVTGLVLALNPAVRWESIVEAGGPLNKSGVPTVGYALRLCFGPAWLQFVPTIVGAALTLWLWRRWRGRFNWREHLSVVLLLSVATMPFGWVFDMAALLPVAIAMLARPGRRLLAVSGLALVDVVLVLQWSRGVSQFSGVWIPFAVALLYRLHSRRHVWPAWLVGRVSRWTQ